jgi:hypothetical protein
MAICSGQFTALSLNCIIKGRDKVCLNGIVRFAALLACAKDDNPLLTRVRIFPRLYASQNLSMDNFQLEKLAVVLREKRQPSTLDAAIGAAQSRGDIRRLSSGCRLTARQNDISLLLTLVSGHGPADGCIYLASGCACSYTQSFNP